MALNQKQIVIWVLVAWLIATSAYAIDMDMLPYSTRNTSAKPIKVERKSQNIEDIILRTEIPYSFPQPVPLQGINIRGLTPKAIEALGENYFVVSLSTKTNKMSDLYKENKANGKANYVTIDCILHPYLGFTNRVHADLIKRNIIPLSKHFLTSLLRAALDDHKQADDVNVRQDIEANIAFLSLAIKLIQPEFIVPEIGQVGELVRSDLDSIGAEKPGFSKILNQYQDFGLYKPIGWYQTSDELSNFYKLKTWLSSLSYPISDVDFQSDKKSVNTFRRSILLYRNIDRSLVDGKPALEAWIKLVKACFLLGAQVQNWQEKNLYPHDYKFVFKESKESLQENITALSDPLYRTKLLLAVRKEKPVSLSSTSIFDLEEDVNSKMSTACFRILPTIGNPEMPWLQAVANVYPRPGIATNVFPVGLIDLNAWGAAQAGNSLLDSSWALDSIVPAYILALKQWVVRRSATGQIQPIENRFWDLMQPCFHLLPEGIQTAVRGEMWANSKLETTFSAWIDNMFVISPGYSNVSNGTFTGKTDSEIQQHTGKQSSNIGPNSINQSVSTNNVPSSVASIPRANTEGQLPSSRKLLATRRASRGHFLDPYPEMYQKLQADALKVQKEILDLGFTIDPVLKKGLDEYVRFFERLEKIASDEVAARPLSSEDLGLLGNIDVILEKIDLPLPQVLYFSAKQGASTHPYAAGGFNLVLGRPGRIYIVLQNKARNECTLARGAVYSYFEIPGSSQTINSALALIDKGLVSPLFWTERFSFLCWSSR